MYVISLLILNEYDRLFAEQNSKEQIEYTYRLSPLLNGSKWWDFISKIHFSPWIPKWAKRVLLMELPRNKWYKLVFDDSLIEIINREERPCLFFTCFRRQYFLLSSFKKLKKEYPHVKIVCIFEDSIQFYQKLNYFDLKYVKQVSDKIYTYNDYDVSQYGLLKSRSFVKKFPILPNNTFPESDFFFVGFSKDRLKELVDIYDFCTQNGYKCLFYISGVDEKDKQIRDGIIYNTVIPYSEVLMHCQKTKCIVNIIQKGALGLSLRDFEAIGMNKMLLTNNPAILTYSSYTEDMVIWFQDLNNQIHKITRYSHCSHWDVSENDTDSSGFRKMVEKELFG